MTKSILQWLKSRTPSQLCVVSLAVLGLFFATLMMIDHDTPRIRMSAGPNSTRRHAVAVFLSEHAAKNGLAVTLLPSAGSEDCLNRTKAGHLDAAIVSNGVIVPNDHDIMVLGAIQTEAVHVLVRKDMVEVGPLSKMIRGKRVNLGEKGSTDRLLALDLLAFGRVLHTACH